MNNPTVARPMQARMKTNAELTIPNAKDFFRQRECILNTSSHPPVKPPISPNINEAMNSGQNEKEPDNFFSVIRSKTKKYSLMKEMQANSVQHKVMIITVRIFFRNPVLFFIVALNKVLQIKAMFKVRTKGNQRPYRLRLGQYKIYYTKS